MNKNREAEELGAMENGNGDPRNPQSDGSLLRRLLGLARPYAKHLTAAFLLDLSDGLWVLLAPLPLKIAIDNVIGARPLPGFLDRWLPESVATSAGALLALAV